MDIYYTNNILLRIYSDIKVYPNNISEISLEKVEFQTLLKKSKLKKKDLASILGIEQSSVNNWGSSKDIPYWVESWLGNFIKAKKYDEAKSLLCKNG